MRRASLWLRWSVRDLRARWISVVAIGLVIAFGTAISTGLASMQEWREGSNDASYAKLNAHDLKVSVAEGSFAPQGRLSRAAREVAPRVGIAAAQERLVVATPVDASYRGRTLLVPGELVGIDLAAPGPAIDAVDAVNGRTLTAGDARRPVAVLDASFAAQHGLPPGVTVRVAGRPLRVVGDGRSPQYFLVTRSGGSDFGGAEARFAVLYAPLAVAQAVSGREGEVNQLLVTVRDGVDAEAAASALERALDRRFPDLGVQVQTLADDPVHYVLYKDASGDQRVYRIIALLILGGAAFAAFNLANRIVEAQRREIGVGMALGVTPRMLAVRPLLLGAEIALLGAALGIALGLLIRIPLRSALVDLLPLPVIVTPFDLSSFVLWGAAGFVIPVLAAALPVWRAIRVPPIDAIRVGFRSAKGGGLAPLLRRVRVPGGSLAQMPARNVLRAPRRSLMTALGVAAVITALVALLGLIDSFSATVDRTRAVTAGSTPQRLDVALDRALPAGAPAVRRIERDPAVGAAEGRIVVPGELRDGDGEFGVSVTVLGGSGEMWTPQVTAGRLPRGPREVLLSAKAAEDLGVGPGDTVALEHPRRVGPDEFATETTRVRISGLHPDPFRTAVYMARPAAGILGLAGAINRLWVLPAPGATQSDVERALFGLPGVVSVEPVTAAADVIDDRLDDLVSIFRVVEVFALLLALLMAFNSSSINADERAREHATMFSFGIPVRTAIRLAVVEGAITGLAATILGLAFGLAFTSWVVNSVVPETVPDLGLVIELAPASFGIAAVLGVAAVALAPILTARRMRRMDIPATLRVVE